MIDLNEVSNRISDVIHTITVAQNPLVALDEAKSLDDYLESVSKKVQSDLTLYTTQELTQFKINLSYARTAMLKLQQKLDFTYKLN